MTAIVDFRQHARPVSEAELKQWLVPFDRDLPPHTWTEATVDYDGLTLTGSPDHGSYTITRTSRHFECGSLSSASCDTIELLVYLGFGERSSIEAFVFNEFHCHFTKSA